ncbi:MAG: hypothetical protein JXL97_13795 [Bacteroidales bacterium]|nr:hypothetical protein [Bacteroidales bacterium]
MSDYKECLAQGKTFINFGDPNNAPALKYSLPQKTTFSVYGRQKIKLRSEFFKQGYTHAINAATDLLSKKTIEDIEKEIVSSVENGVNTSYLLGFVDKLENNRLIKTNSSKTIIETQLDKPQNEFYDSSEERKISISNNLGIDTRSLATKIKEGYIPIVTESLGKFKRQVRFIKRPQLPSRPRIFAILEYKVASYLGDYGAGKTLKTFSLLPGEKTSISVKSFTESTEYKAKSQNVLDSFSENSAEEFESILHDESNIVNSATDTSMYDTTTTKNSSVSTSVSLSGVIQGILAKIGIGYEHDQEEVDENVDTNTSVNESHVNNINETLEKHTNSTNSLREVEVNTTTESSRTNSVENSTIRELMNPNLNRVLNFVFRQLLQEYITITYLSDIKFIYTDGHPENTMVVPVNELNDLLKTAINPQYIDIVRDLIVDEFTEIVNYNNHSVEFLQLLTKEVLTVDPNNIMNLIPETISYYKKKANLLDEYKTGEIQLLVPGVILKVVKNTLRTDSVIVDSLLGQGDALDCFNKLQQEAKSVQVQLENNKLIAETARIEANTTIEQEKINRLLNVIENLPAEIQPEALKAVFSKCCKDSDFIINNNQTEPTI